MSERGDPLRFWDIADHIRFLERELDGVEREAFLQDRLLPNAVLYALQTIGEAANALSAAAKAQVPAAPWSGMRAVRNRLVHGYFAIDLEEVWRIARVDAQHLKETLAAAGVLPDLEPPA